MPKIKSLRNWLSISNLQTISDPQEDCVPVKEKYNQKKHSRERINLLEKSTEVIFRKIFVWTPQDKECANWRLRDIRKAKKKKKKKTEGKKIDSLLLMDFKS